VPWCDLCEREDCFTHPPIDLLEDYPFLPGGRPLVEGEEGIDYVIAPHRVDDPDLRRAVYGVGDRVPMADAIKYGLVTGPEKPAPPAAPRGKRKGSDRAKHGPEHDRARKPQEDR
jgi:hypothetical protein